MVWMSPRTALALALLALFALPATASAQTGGADAPAEGGTAAPDGRFDGGEDGALKAPSPVPEAESPSPPVVVPLPQTPPAASPVPEARASQRGEDDTEVEVPLPRRDPTAPPPEPEEPREDDEEPTVLGGLASTGFAVAFLAALGGLLGITGVWLRHASRRAATGA
jgi:hypothetical protein